MVSLVTCAYLHFLELQVLPLVHSSGANKAGNNTRQDNEQAIAGVPPSQPRTSCEPPVPCASLNTPGI